MLTDPLVIARFWSKVDVRARKHCWLWRGARYPAGYGQFRIKQPRRLILAHRTALELSTGSDIPDDLLALHSCDNPPCCNPHHLSAGSRSQNMMEALARGRIVPRSQLGDLNGNAILSEADVHLIRRLISSGMTNIEIGKMFGVTDSTISAIKRRKAWAHITAS